MVRLTSATLLEDGGPGFFRRQGQRRVQLSEVAGRFPFAHPGLCVTPRVMGLL